MIPRELILLRVIESYGWDVEFMFDSGSGIRFVRATRERKMLTGSTPEDLFNEWSNDPEVIAELFKNPKFSGLASEQKPPVIPRGA